MTGPRPSSKRAWAAELLIACVVFFLVASAATWPLVGHMSTGVYGFGNDNFGGVWNTSYLHEAFWGPEKLGRSMESGYPWGISLPLEAIQPIDWFFIIVFGGIHDGLFAYNFQTFLGFIASGGAAYFATRWIGAGRYAALILGGLFSIVPAHLAFAMQYQALSNLAFLPLAVVAFIAASRTPTFKTGVQLGVAVGLVWWGSYYYGWFGMLVLGTSMVVMLLLTALRREGEQLRRLAKMIGGSVVGGAVMIGLPVVLILNRIASDPLTKERVLGDPAYTLAPPWSAFLPPHDNPLIGTLTRDWVRGHNGLLPLYEQSNYTGIAVTIAALAGIAVLLRSDRRTALALIAAVGMAFLLMVGPFIPYRFWSPAAWLGGETVPHVKSLAGYLFNLTPTFRYYGRAWVWGLAVVFVVAGLGAAMLQRRLVNRPGLLAAILTAFGLFGVGEYINRPPSHWVGTNPEKNDWVQAVEKLPKQAVLVDYPAAGYSTPRSLYYLFWTSFHQRRTLNPYLFKRGGDLQTTIQDPESARAGAELSRIGVTHAVVHTGLPNPTFPPYQPALPNDALPANAGSNNPWFQRESSGGDYVIYRILKTPRTDVSTTAGWDAGFLPGEMEGTREARWMVNPTGELHVSAAQGNQILSVPVRAAVGTYDVKLCIAGGSTSRRCVLRSVSADRYTNVRLPIPRANYLTISVETGAPVSDLGKLAGNADTRTATIRVAQPTVRDRR